MRSPVDSVKRLLIGRAMRSDRMGQQLLPKRIALPVFASDALSSNAYATEQILLVLAVGGLAFYSFSVPIALAVVAVMAVVITSYRITVQAYPSGGGDFEVATENLGRIPGLIVGSALLIDYSVTVAVSVTAAAANLGSGVSFFAEHALLISIGLTVVLTTMNLRGVRESGKIFAVPSYAFIFAIFAMVVYAAIRYLLGDEMVAESASFEIEPESAFVGLAIAFLVIRAFSSGNTALAGIEAIANGVPAFKEPKAKNAARTLLLLGVISSLMFVSITVLSQLTQVRVVLDPSNLIGAPEGYQQKTVIAQVSQAVFSNFPVGALFVTIATVLILVLAANTAFNGFPVLAAVLANFRYLPKQLTTRGDRLAFSNAIIILGLGAVALIWAFDASVEALIQIYIIGVFTSFSLGQLGMVRHWNKKLELVTNDDDRRRFKRYRAVAAVGSALTGVVLVLVLMTKFTRGAWLIVILIPTLMFIMLAIQRHYKKVATELAVSADEPLTLPSRVHALVLVSKLHRPALQAIAYARAARPTVLEAVTVDISPAETAELIDEWAEREIPVTLRVLESPFREMTRPILDYVESIKTDNPRDLITIYIPEYVVGHWWESFLHNQSALRLKARLLFSRGVVVVSVPWQLESASRVVAKPVRSAPGAVRRGE